MPKYLILHNAAEPAKEFMAKFTPEQMRAGIEDWQRWRTEAEKTVKFEWGMPLQAVARVTPTGVETSDSTASGYSIIEADSEAAVTNVLRNHPHLKRNGASLDVLEMVAMPGMDTASK